VAAELVKVHTPAGVEMANGTDGIALADSKEGNVPSLCETVLMLQASAI
jgi:hypothetical protein